MRNQSNKPLPTLQSAAITSVPPKSCYGYFTDTYKNTNPTAAIYCRLSEEDRHKRSETDDSGSIQNQKSLLLQYAMERQWEIYNIYSDDDYAGADRKRPEFNRLLLDAENRRFDIVLCKSQSRFTRELEIVERYIHGLFPAWGIRFVSVVDNADTEIRGNKKARQINGLINEWYLEDMSDNIKSVLTSRRKSGFHIGSFALYGYIKDPDNKGRLLVDGEAAEIVREVFNLFARGYGKTSIARILNERGVPNPTEYKRLKNLLYKPPKSKNGTLWKYFAIADMLANEIYIGNMVQGKYGSASYKTKENRPIPREQWIRVEGTHEPIIDRELWDRVQTLLRQRHKPFAEGQIGIFAKKAICMSCGYTMRSCKSRGRHYLKCGTRHAAKDACEGSFISVEALEKAVSQELVKMNDEYLDKDLLARSESHFQNHQAQREKVLAEIAGYDKKIAEYSKGIRDAYMDKVRGVITEEEYVEFAGDFAREKERLEKLAATARERLDGIDARIQATADERITIFEYAENSQTDRMLIETMIEYVSIGRTNPETNLLHIEIHWSF